MKWEVGLEEDKKISAICDRAMKRVGGIKVDLAMDIVATHNNGCPLDFDKLLNFRDFDFYHDIFGIINCLNRNTGQLMNCFLPRCARPSE